MDVLVLCTDSLTGKSNRASIYSMNYFDDNTLAPNFGKTNICIGYRELLGETYQKILKRQTLPPNTIPFDCINSSEFREITIAEADALRTESNGFYLLIYSDLSKFQFEIDRMLNAQAFSLRVSVRKGIEQLIKSRDETKLKSITDGEDILSRSSLDIAFYLSNILSPMVSKIEYWGLRYMDVDWGSDIRTVRFIPFNVGAELKSHPEYWEELYKWKDKKAFLRQLYKHTDDNPIGPRILGYSPSYSLKSGRWVWGCR